VILLLLVGTLGQLDSLYTASRYAEVARQAPMTLAEVKTRADSARAYELQASALVAIGQQPAAESAFGRMLEIDPDRRLDPQAVSPKIRAVFERVLVSGRPGRAATPARQPVPVSVIVPGLSQIRAGHAALGWTMAGIVLASAAGAGASHVAYQHTYDQYLQATIPTDVASRYETADRWYQTRTLFISAAVVAAAWSLIDGLLHL
jgi:hypothetical protein